MDMSIQNAYGEVIKTYDRKVSEQKNWRRASQKKKRKLPYNSREISSQLIRASKLGGVSQVLVRAKGKVEYLQRCAASGKYNENEVRAALAHAKRMVKCAQKKVRNVKEEEKLERKRRKKSFSKEISEENKIRQRLQQELRKMRHRHRGEEHNEIKAADLRYLKDKLREQQRETSMEYSDSAEDMGMYDIPLETTAEAGVEMSGTIAGGGVDVLM